MYQSFTSSLVRGSTTPKVHLIILRPPREAVGSSAIVVVLVLVMDHLQQDIDVPLHLVAEEQRDVEDHLIDPLHNCKL